MNGRRFGRTVFSASDDDCFGPTRSNRGRRSGATDAHHIRCPFGSFFVFLLLLPNALIIHADHVPVLRRRHFPFHLLFVLLDKAQFVRAPRCGEPLFVSRHARAKGMQIVVGFFILPVTAHCRLQPKHHARRSSDRRNIVRRLLLSFCLRCKSIAMQTCEWLIKVRIRRCSLSPSLVELRVCRQWRCW